MTRLVDLIRFHYDKPVVLKDDTGCDDCYCVGGGLLLYAYALGYRDPVTPEPVHFPNRVMLGRVLQYYNPQLSDGEAVELAHNIIYSNDAALFEQAWRYAAEALPTTIGDVLP